MSSNSNNNCDDTETKNTNDTQGKRKVPMDSSSQPTISEYCQSLESWLNNVYTQRAVATSAYFTAYSLLFGNNSSLLNGPQSGSQQQSGADGANFVNRAGNNNGSIRDYQAAAVAQQQYPDTLRIAPLWKRLVAEVFDFLVLLVVKVFVTLSLIDNFQLIDLDSIELDVIQDSGSIYDIALSLTSELILLELTHRVVVCFFEAYCLAKNGCTPGKNLLRLRVVHCESITELNNRLVITPGTTLTFPRALLRSFIKNFSIALFFPMCFTLLHFENNQTVYDHISKSIVVSF